MKDNTFDAYNDRDVQEILQRKMQELQKKISFFKMMSEIKNPIILTDSTFNENLLKYPFLVVDFWAPWCGPCKMLTPVIEQLAIEFKGKIVFGKINVDENPIMSGSFGIQSIPTVLIFRNGNMVDKIIGILPKVQIQQRLNKLIEN